MKASYKIYLDHQGLTTLNCNLHLHCWLTSQIWVISGFNVLSTGTTGTSVVLLWPHDKRTPLMHLCFAGPQPRLCRTGNKTVFFDRPKPRLLGVSVLRLHVQFTEKLHQRCKVCRTGGYNYTHPAVAFPIIDRIPYLTTLSISGLIE